MKEDGHMEKKRTIALQGNLKQQDIKDLFERATLDFQQVESISFGAMRALLDLQRKSQGLDIANASDAVFLRFVDTGMDRFIPITHQPKDIDLSAFQPFGDANQGQCYNDDEGDCIVKMYHDTILFSTAQREIHGAYAAFVSGVPTPLVGGEVKSGDERGVLFERAKNKKSISRLIADNPKDIEEYVELFADMSKQLHHTQCETSLLEPCADYLRGQVENTVYLDDKKKKKMLQVIDDTEPATTCLHGDLHIGNLIVCDSGCQFIDLGDFSYGNPLYDLGQTYFSCGFLSKMSGDAVQSNYHFDPDTMDHVWQLFMKYYFGAETLDQRKEVEHMLLPYATLRIITLCNLIEKMYDYRKELIEGEFFSKI